MLEITVEIECAEDECIGLLHALKADDSNFWKTTVQDGKIKIIASTEKITSLYNLVDDLLRSYEVFKKIY